MSFVREGKLCESPYPQRGIKFSGLNYLRLPDVELLFHKRETPHFCLWVSFFQNALVSALEHRLCKPLIW